jgi:hypothetical protein
MNLSSSIPCWCLLFFHKAEEEIKKAARKPLV